MKHLKILLVLLFVSYPFEAFQLFALFGYGVKAVDVLLMVFYIIFLKRFIWEGESYKISLKPYLQIFGIFLIAVTVSGLSPLLVGSKEGILQFVKTYAHFIYILLFVPIAIAYPFKSSDWIRVIKALLIFSLFINIFGIYQVFARAFELPLAWLGLNNISIVSRGTSEMSDVTQLSIQFMNLFRATSIFTEPSFLGNFNTLMLVFQITPFILRKKQIIENKWLSISIFAFLIIGSFATFSLTAFLAISAVMTGLFTFEKRDYLKHTLLAMLVVVVFVFAADQVVESYTETSVVGLFSSRLEGILVGGKDVNKQISGESYSYRALIIQTSIDIWENNPIIGCGMGNFFLNQDREIPFAHDGFWGTLAETGLFGNISFSAFFLSIFLSIYYVRKKGISRNSDEGTQWLFGVIPYMMIQLFTINFFTASYLIYVHLWFYIAIVLWTLNQIFIDNNIDVKTIKFSNRHLKLKVLNALNKSRVDND